MLIEDRNHEFKAILNEKLEKEAVAFFNTSEGGHIYIGIDDDGNVIGVEDVDEMQLMITNRLKQNISPSVLGLFDILTESIEDKVIIHIILASGIEKPYFIKNKGMNEKGCFIRIASSSQPMPQFMIDKLYACRIRVSLFNIPAPRQKLSFSQLSIYYDSAGYTVNDNFLKSLDFYTEDGRYNYIAYLFADKNDVSIQFAKYAGKDKLKLIENQEFGNRCILSAMSKIFDKLDAENRTYTKITYPKRFERFRFQKDALRELVINAFVHNDYSYEVSPLFELYEDRLVITTYGGLVSGLSMEDFLNGCSVPRNREVMRIYKDLDLAERLGSGMQTILRYYDASIFHFLDNFLRIEIPLDNQGFPVEEYVLDDPYVRSDGMVEDSSLDADRQISENVTSKDKNVTSKDKNVTSKDKNVTSKDKNVTLSEEGESYTARQLKILEIFNKNPHCTLKEIAENLSVSRRTIIRDIDVLKNCNVLEMKGSKKKPVWVLLKGDYHGR